MARLDNAFVARGRSQLGQRYVQGFNKRDTVESVCNLLCPYRTADLIASVCSAMQPDTHLTLRRRL